MALSTGEMAERTLEDVLVAIVIGYEMFSRLRDVMRFSSLWGLRISAGFLPEQRRSVPGGEVAFGLTFGAVGVCYDARVRRQVTLGACGSVMAGAFHTVVFDPIPVDPGQRLWAAASAGLRLELWPWSNAGIDAGAELFVPFARHEYVIARASPGSSPSSVFAEPAVGFLGRLGMGLRF